MLFNKPESVIICGCGRFGSTLAGKFSELGYNTAIVDKSTGAFRKLPDSYSGHTHIGDGSDIEFLQQIDAHKASIVIATTNDDNTNSLIGQIAGRIFEIDNVYIRLNDEEKAELLAEFSNIQVISPHALSMREFQRLSGVDLLGGAF